MNVEFLTPARILKSGGILAPLTSKQPEVGHHLTVKIGDQDYDLRITGVDPCPEDLNTVDPEVVIGYGLTDHRDMHSLWMRTFPTVRPMLVRYFCPEGAAPVKVTIPVPVLPPPLPPVLAPKPPPAYSVMTAQESPCNLETLLDSMVRAVRQLNNVLSHYSTVNGSTARILDGALQVPEAMRAQIEYLNELAIKVDEIREEKGSIL